MFRTARQFLNEYKVVRGMLSYAILWPMGCLIEQTLVEKKSWQTYDWKKCLRYFAYFYVDIIFFSTYFYGFYVVFTTLTSLVMSAKSVC